MTGAQLYKRATPTSRTSRRANRATQVEHRPVELPDACFREHSLRKIVKLVRQAQPRPWLGETEGPFINAGDVHVDDRPRFAKSEAEDRIGHVSTNIRERLQLYSRLRYVAT